MVVNDAPTDRQTQARPAFLRREKRLEQMRDVYKRQPSSCANGFFSRTFTFVTSCGKRVQHFASCESGTPFALTMRKICSAATSPSPVVP